MFRDIVDVHMSMRSHRLRVVLAGQISIYTCNVTRLTYTRFLSCSFCTSFNLRDCFSVKVISFKTMAAVAGKMSLMGLSIRPGNLVAVRGNWKQILVKQIMFVEYSCIQLADMNN